MWARSQPALWRGPSSGRGGPALVSCRGRGGEKAAQTWGRMGGCSPVRAKGPGTLRAGGRGEGPQSTHSPPRGRCLWAATPSPPGRSAAAPHGLVGGGAPRGRLVSQQRGAPGVLVLTRSLPWAFRPPPCLCPAKATQLAGRFWALTQPWAVASTRLLATQWALSPWERVGEAGAPAATPQLVCCSGESLSAHLYPGPGARDLPLFGVGAMGLWTRVPSSMGRLPEGPLGRFTGWDGCRLRVGAQQALLLSWPGGDPPAGGVSVIEASPWTGHGTPGLGRRPILRDSQVCLS